MSPTEGREGNLEDDLGGMSVRARDENEGEKNRDNEGEEERISRKQSGGSKAEQALRERGPWRYGEQQCRS